MRGSKRDKKSHVLKRQQTKERGYMDQTSNVFTDANFQTEVLEAKEPVFVLFTAPWCGPCKVMRPIIESLVAEQSGKIKFGSLNTDENPDIASAYGITAIPTVLLFERGQIVDRFIGLTGKERLEEALAIRFHQNPNHQIPKTHEVKIKYVVMEEERGKSEPFRRFAKENFESWQDAERAIVQYMEQADPFAGCPDLWVRKTFHAEYKG